MTGFARFWRHPEGAIGGGLLIVMVVVALAASLIAPGDPLAIVTEPLKAPFVDPAAILGSDRLGRSLAAELVHGTRTTLAVGFAAAGAALAIGVLIGTFAGFLGGFVDEAAMRLTDAFQTVPSFLMVLAFVGTLGPTLPNIVSAIAIASWTGPARIARAQVLSIRESDHVAAARVVGMHPVRIALREVLPLALPPVLTLASVIVAGAILTEAALSFLGLGDPARVTWGGMIAEGRNVLRSAPFLSIVPGIALVATVLAVHLIGEAAVEVLGRRRAAP